MDKRNFIIYILKKYVFLSYRGGKVWVKVIFFGCYVCVVLQIGIVLGVVIYGDFYDYYILFMFLVYYRFLLVRSLGFV